MPHYDCSACLEECRGRRARIGDDKMCPSCLIQLFDLATTDETEFPAHWGKQQIRVEDCLDILPPRLVERYKAVEKEYTTPAGDRVYCHFTDAPRRPDPCNTFVGTWTPRKECARCEKCMWYTCLRCEETFSPSATHGRVMRIDHDCNRDRLKEIRLQPLREQQRGRDYQLCPNPACKRVWSLHDGCNHMRCACKVHFCFICGKVVKDGEGHWRSKGGCPRWNFPGDKNAQYDDQDRWNDNGDWDQAEEAGGPVLEHELAAAMTEGRVYLETADPQLRRRLAGLSMQLSVERGLTLIFMDKQGQKVNPMAGLSQEQMPLLVIRPRAKDRGPMRALPEAISHGLLRMFGLKHKVSRFKLRPG